MRDVPLALLLQDVFGRLAKGIATLDPWNSLVDLEALLVGRARAAFLVRWFGPFLPLDGFHLRIGIENLRALRDRYLRVLGATDTRLLSQGPNLLEPLAGMTGTLLGSVIAAPNGILIFIWIQQKVLHWGVTAFTVLNFFTLGLLSMTLTVAAGLSGGAALGLGFLFTPGTRAVQDFLGAMAGLALPLRDFWLTISGPRDRVKNPILREVLLLTDRLATLFPFLMSTVAIFFTYIGPLLDPLYRQYELLRALAEAVGGLLRLLLESTVAALQGWFDPNVATSLPARLSSVMELAIGAAARLLAVIEQRLVAYPLDVIVSIFSALNNHVSELARVLVDFAVEAVTNSPPVRALRALIERFQLVRSIWSAHPKTALVPALIRHFTKSSGGSSSPSRIPTFYPPPDWLMRRLLDFPRIPLSDLPSLAAARRTSGTGSPFLPVGRPSITMPASVFSGERARLESELVARRPGLSAPDALAAVRLDEARLREDILGVVARLFPEAIATHLPRLRSTFEAVDRELFGAGAPQLPVRALLDSDRLKPVVGQLVVRVRGGSRAAAEEWTEGLRAAIRAQPYLVSAS